MTEPEVLSRELIDDALNRLPGWTTDGEQIQRAVELTDEQHEVVAAHVDEVQTAMNHHADVARDGQTTTFTLSTHSAGGVTVLDLTLASEIDSSCRLQTGEKAQQPPDELIASHNLQAEDAGTADATEQPGAESKARTAALVADVQDSRGVSGEDNTLPSGDSVSSPTDGADTGGAHRADGSGGTSAHRAEPTGRREVWAENPADETATASADGVQRPAEPAESEQDRQRDWELEQEGGARPHNPVDPGARDNL